MTIDLSGPPPSGPPPAGPPGFSRRHLLVSAACGLAGGVGGTYAVIRFGLPGPPEVDAATVAAVEAARVTERFVDLPTPGPSATVTVGRSGRCTVTVGATIVYGSATDGVLSQGGAVAFDLTGANERPPSLAGAGRSFLSVSGVEHPYTVTQSFTATTVIDGLRPGRTTFTAKYRADGNAPVPVFFSHRTIHVATLTPG